MSRLDDRLTRELERAARPASPAGAFERVDRRRGRRARLRKIQSGSLIVVVLAGTLAGVGVLRDAFREPADRIGGTPSVGNGLIVFSEVRNAGQRLWTVQPDGTGTRQLTSGDGASDTGPAVSPDGQLVAFTRTDEQGSAIYVVALDGTGLRRVTQPSWQARDPDWSPDGVELVFVGDAGDGEGLYVMAPLLEGAAPHRISDPDLSAESDPSWSPDGSTIVFTAGSVVPGVAEPINFDIFETPADGSGPARNVTDTPELAETAPAWSPDGQLIAFVRVPNTLDDTPAGGIALMRAGGTAVRQLTDDGAFEQNPTWAPDGSVIAFDRDDPAGTSIYTIRPDGTELTKVTVGSDPAWQPLRETTSIPPIPSTVEGDLGLGFPVCNVETLNDDFDGDGVVDTAWTATKATDVGPCPTFDGSFTVVAVDVTGDGVADGSAGPLEHCVQCRPFAATDLDADGIRELVVMTQLSSTTEYALFSIRPELAEAGRALEWITVAPPGDPDAGFPAGQPFTFWAGGDEGYASYVRCADDRPDLLITQTSHPVEGPGSDVRRIQHTELRLDNGQMRVIGRSDSTEPTSAPFDGWSGPACGVNFYP